MARLRDSDSGGDVRSDNAPYDSLECNVAGWDFTPDDFREPDARTSVCDLESLALIQRRGSLNRIVVDSTQQDV